MGEKEPRPQETSLATPSWQKITEAVTFLKRQVSETRETGQKLLNHPEIQEGSEAAFRAAVNVAISCADLVPVAGAVASWGADALKIIDEVRYRKAQKEALERGENPLNVKHKRYNLTPDVHVLVATLTEGLEVFTLLGIPMPTHAIETANQLWYDVPRLYKGIQKTREVLIKIHAQREKARKAAAQFDTSQFMKEVFNNLEEGDDE
ncbi:MAG: hypothetical protein AAB448_01125 [Patescibacteria group bacterium]